MALHVLQIITTVSVHRPGGSLRSRDSNVRIQCYRWATAPAMVCIPFTSGISQTCHDSYAFWENIDLFLLLHLLFCHSGTKLKDQQTKKTKFTRVSHFYFTTWNSHFVKVMLWAMMQAAHDFKSSVIAFVKVQFLQLDIWICEMGWNKSFFPGRLHIQKPSSNIWRTRWRFLEENIRKTKDKKSEGFIDNAVQYADVRNNEMTLFIWQSKFIYTVFTAM